ncbi:hypothetical protein [Parablautia muri]|uniref:Uncharacterized protein n=1 Tax=Parablautia muri TaxID=2320879 RepID=A0A9X5BHV7_9FIRM|nr:hypothetical protein [Parablautia muri]NBJ94396.1 hypothetical protein [Parablautia muri]
MSFRYRPVAESTNLLERFKKAQGQVRPAVEAMLEDAEQAASSESGHISYEDVFGAEDQE